jgi:hypothetical protein
VNPFVSRDRSQFLWGGLRDFHDLRRKFSRNAENRPQQSKRENQPEAYSRAQTRAPPGGAGVMAENRAHTHAQDGGRGGEIYAHGPARLQHAQASETGEGLGVIGAMLGPAADHGHVAARACAGAPAIPLGERKGCSAPDR